MKCLEERIIATYFTLIQQPIYHLSFCGNLLASPTLAVHPIYPWPNSTFNLLKFFQQGKGVCRCPFHDILENYREILLTPLLAGLWESRPLLVCRLQELHINGELLRRFFLFLYYITSSTWRSFGLSVQIFRVFLCFLPRIWHVLCCHSFIIIQADTYYEDIFILPSPHTACNLTLPLATSGILDPWAWKFL